MAQKKKYRIYKAGGQHGRIINPTAKFLMKAEAGMQQPTSADMIMMQEQQMGQRPMQGPSPEEMQMMQQSQGQPPMQGMPPQPSEEEMMMMQQQQEVQQLVMSVKEAIEGGADVEDIARDLQQDGHSADKIKYILVESGIPEEDAEVLIPSDQLEQPEPAELIDMQSEEVPEETDRGFVKRRVGELKKAQEGLEANKDSEDGTDVKNTFRSSTFDIPEGGRKDLVSGFLSGINDSVQTHQFEQQAENELMQAKTGREVRQERREANRARKEMRRAARETRKYGLDPFLFSEEGTFHGEKRPLGLGYKSFDMTWKNASPMPYHFYEGVTNPWFNSRGYYTNVAKKIIAPGESLLNSEVEEDVNEHVGKTHTWDDFEQEDKAPVKSESSDKPVNQRVSGSSNSYKRSNSIRQRNNIPNTQLSPTASSSSGTNPTIGALFEFQKSLPGGTKDMVSFVNAIKRNPDSLKTLTNQANKTGWTTEQGPINKKEATNVEIYPEKGEVDGETGTGAKIVLGGISLATARWIYRSMAAGRPVKPSILKWMKSKGVKPPKPGTTQSFNSWLGGAEANVKAKATKPKPKVKVKSKGSTSKGSTSRGSTSRGTKGTKGNAKYDKLMKGSKKLLKGATKLMRGVTPMLNLDFLVDPFGLNKSMGLPGGSGMPVSQIGGFIDSNNPDLYKFVYGGDEAYSGIPQGEDVYDPYMPYMHKGGEPGHMHEDEQIRVVKEKNYLGQGQKLYNEEDYNKLNVVYADPNNPEAAFEAGDRFGAKTVINYHDGSSESYDNPTVYMSPLSARKPVGSYDQTLQNWMMNNIRTGNERDPGDIREEVLYDNQGLGKPFKGETKGEYYQRVGGDEGLKYMMDAYDVDPNEKYATGGQLDTYQGDQGGSQVATLDDYINRMLEFEDKQGSSQGTHLDNYGINTPAQYYNPYDPNYKAEYGNQYNYMRDGVTRDEANKFARSMYYNQGIEKFKPSVAGRLVDYRYNTGRNYKDFLLLNEGLITLDEIASGDPAVRTKLDNLWTANEAKLTSSMDDEGYLKKFDQTRDKLAKDFQARMLKTDPNFFGGADPYGKSWHDRSTYYSALDYDRPTESNDENVDIFVEGQEDKKKANQRMKPQVKGYRYNPTGGAFFTQGNPYFDRYNAYGRINKKFSKRPGIFSKHTYLDPINAFARNLPPEALASLMKSGKAGVLKRGMFRGRDPETGLRLPKREAYLQWGDGITPTKNDSNKVPSIRELRKNKREDIRSTRRDRGLNPFDKMNINAGIRSAFRDTKRAIRRGEYGIDDSDMMSAEELKQQQNADAEWRKRYDASRVKPNNTVDPNANVQMTKQGNVLNEQEEEEEQRFDPNMGSDNANMRYGGFFNHGGTHPDQQPNPYGNTPMGQGVNAMMGMFGNTNNMQTQLQSSANFQANPQFTPQNTGASPQQGGSNFSYSPGVTSKFGTVPNFAQMMKDGAPPMIDENNNGIPDTIERPSDGTNYVDRQPMIGPQNKPEEDKENPGGKARWSVDNAYDVNLEEAAYVGEDWTKMFTGIANDVNSRTQDMARADLKRDDAIDYGRQQGIHKINTRGTQQIKKDDQFSNNQNFYSKYGGDVSTMYEEGEEYDLTLEEIAEILANGGNIEF